MLKPFLIKHVRVFSLLVVLFVLSPLSLCLFPQAYAQVSSLQQSIVAGSASPSPTPDPYACVQMSSMVTVGIPAPHRLDVEIAFINRECKEDIASFSARIDVFIQGCETDPESQRPDGRDMGIEESTTFAMPHRAVKNIRATVTGLCTRCHCGLCQQEDCEHDESLKQPSEAPSFGIALHISGEGKTLTDRRVSTGTRQTPFYHAGGRGTKFRLVLPEIRAHPLWADADKSARVIVRPCGANAMVIFTRQPQPVSS